MILVDSSVWIDYFNANDTVAADFLDRALGVEPIAVGDLILMEVLQGFREEASFRTAKRLLEDLTIYEMLNAERAVVAAQNFRTLRRVGVTVRKSVDVVIGSFCISENLPLLYSDRDFEPMVEHLGLRRALSAA